MTDSQLSEVIRESKMNFSPSSKNCTFEDDSLSQNTKAMIKNGNYILPGLSQGGIDFLEMDLRGMESVRVEIQKNPEKIPELPIHSIENSEKKRTDRISVEVGEKLADISIDVFEDDEEEAVASDHYPSILNISMDIFNASDSPQDGIMNASFNDSVMTLTQRQFDSQSPPIPFLRNRTADEQREHKLQKELEKSVRKAANEDLRASLRFPKEGKAPRENQPDIYADPRDRDVFADDLDNIDLNITNAATGLDQPAIQNETFLMVTVAEPKSKKISDFVSIELPNEDRYLWARMGVLIPFHVSWNVPDAPRPLKLKVRFVHYDHYCPIEQAILSVDTDVTKCQRHVDEESSSFPRDSFFYVTSRDVLWIPASSTERRCKGYSFIADIPASKTEIEFELKFACQEKCMGLEEKRKTMCLVVFLEDEIGNLIKYSAFKEVRVVAYPRRDFKNFVAKGIETDCPPENLSTKRPARVIGYSKTNLEMFNVINAQMLPSTSSNRKRAAEFAVKSESSPEIDVVGTSCDYQRRIMLSGSYRAPQEKMEIDENLEGSERSAKRRKSSSGGIRMIAIEDEEYHAVLSFLAERKRSDRAKANRSIRPKAHPFSLQSVVTSETRIEIWLTTFGKQSHARLFEVQGIHCMKHLITRFEADPMLFTKVGLETKDAEEAQQVFFNFYRVFQADNLNLPHYHLLI